MVSAASLKIYVPINEATEGFNFILGFKNFTKSTVTLMCTFSESTLSQPKSQAIFEVVITKAINNKSAAEFLREAIIATSTSWDTSNVEVIRE